MRKTVHRAGAMAFVLSLLLTGGCGRGRNVKSTGQASYSAFMRESELFVDEYTSGDIERAKMACLKDWAAGLLKRDDPYCGRAYAISMVFAAERLSLICAAQNDNVGRAFWAKWRDENVGLSGSPIEEVTNAVFQLDKEMGVSFRGWQE